MSATFFSFVDGNGVTRYANPTSVDGFYEVKEQGVFVTIISIGGETVLANATPDAVSTAVTGVPTAQIQPLATVIQAQQTPPT